MKNLLRGAFCALTPLLLAAAEVSPNTLIRMAPMVTPPVIDGKINYGEWQDGSVNFGGVSTSSKLMTPRLVCWYFGYDKEFFYFGCDSEAPMRPQQLAENDTVTLSLQLPGTKEPQIFTINSFGKHDLPAGSKIANQVMTEFDRKIVKPHWHLEGKIPLAALGVKALTSEPWGVQMSREFRSDDEVACWHLPAKPGELGTLIPDPAAPACGFEGFGHLMWDQSGNYFMKFYAKNTTPNSMLFTPECDMVASGMSHATLNPADTANFTKGKVVKAISHYTRSLKSGECRNLNQTLYALFPGMIRTVIGKITDKTGKIVYYNRAFSWNLAAKDNKRWNAKGLLKLESAFYPSHGNLLLVRTNVPKTLRSEETAVYNNETPQGFRDITVTVVGPGEKVFAKIDHLEKIPGNETRFNLGDKLPYGDYLVNMTAVNPEGKAITDQRTFSVRKFAWQNNTIGKERVIIPPFTPIKADEKANELHFLQTGYHVANGFWDKVYAQGENILASPVELLIDGNRFTPVSTKFVSVEKDRVVVESTIRYKKLDIVVHQDYDYDGFCLTTLKFRPQGFVKFRHLELVMPVRDEVVKYYNMFIHPSSKKSIWNIPAGTGVIWDMTKAASKSNRPGMFTPYCWLGGSYKGFCWIADSHQHYRIERDTPCQRITRDNGAVSFRVDLVNKLTALNKKDQFEIKMGFQPTPVKPQNKNFYRLGSIMYNDAWYPPHSELATLVGDMVSDLVPPPKDMSFLDYVYSIKAIPPEKRDKAEYQKHLEAYYNKHLQEVLRGNEGTAETFRYKLNTHLTRTAGKLFVYTDPLGLSCFFPEDEMYKAEWSAWNYPPEEPYYNEYMCRVVPSRIDMQLWEEREAVRHNLDGVNFDCFGQGGGFNTVTGVAWLDENGATNKNTQLLGWREIVRRTAHMLYTEKKMLFGVPWVDLHATGGMIVPVCSFASATTATELGGRRGEFQDRYDESQWLADILGTQSGVVAHPIVVCPGKVNELESMIAFFYGFGFVNITDQGVKQDGGKFAWVRRAIDLPFEFGIGRENVEMIRFFDDGKKPVTHDAKDVRMTILKRNDGKTLLLFGNLGDAATIRFDVAGLGCGKCRISDAWNNKVLDKPEIPIRRRSFAAVLVEKE